MVKADSLEDLAKKMNLPEGALTEAAAKFNETAAKGEKDEFGRELTAPLSEEGPYYAFVGASYIYSTVGGLDVNTDMQVLGSDNATPINGLYAVGTDSLASCSQNSVSTSPTAARLRVGLIRPDGWPASARSTA